MSFLCYPIDAIFRKILYENDIFLKNSVSVFWVSFFSSFLCTPNGNNNLINLLTFYNNLMDLLTFSRITALT